MSRQPPLPHLSLASTSTAIHQARAVMADWQRTVMPLGISGKRRKKMHRGSFSGQSYVVRCACCFQRSLDLLLLLTTTQVDHDSTSPLAALQDHLHPQFPHLHRLLPAPILADLLLLATQQTQKELDSVPHHHHSNLPEPRTATLQGWRTQQPRPFAGSSAGGVEIVQFAICVDTGVGEGGYRGHRGGTCI